MRKLLTSILFLLAVAVQAQNDPVFYFNNALESLESGDCEKAHRNYDIYKYLTKKTSSYVEKAIDECRKQNNSATIPVYEISNMQCFFYMPRVLMKESEAEAAAKASVVGNYSDWRLPTVGELQVVLQWFYASGDTALVQLSDMGRYWSSEKSVTRKYVYYHGLQTSSAIGDSDLAYCIIVRGGNAASVANNVSPKTTAYDFKTLRTENGNIFQITSDGGKKKLSDKDVRKLFMGTESYDLYDRACRLKDAAPSLKLGFYIVGILAVSTGAGCQWGWAYYDEGGFKDATHRNLVIAGFSLIGAGTAFLLSPLMIDGSVKAKIKKAVRLYNNDNRYRQNDVSFNMGFTGNGISLSLSF